MPRVDPSVIFEFACHEQNYGVINGPGHAAPGARSRSERRVGEGQAGWRRIGYVPGGG